MVAAAGIDWPSTVETWLSIGANAIAIGTFIASRRMVVSWATSLRRELGAARFTRPDQAPPSAVIIPHRQIQVQEPTGAGPYDWRFSWTEMSGEFRQASGEIKSPRLRWHLRGQAAKPPSSANARRNFPVVGEIRYLLQQNGDVDFAEITALDFIPGNWFSNWIIGAGWFRLPYSWLKRIFRPSGGEKVADA